MFYVPQYARAKLPPPEVQKGVLPRPLPHRPLSAEGWFLLRCAQQPRAQESRARPVQWRLLIYDDILIKLISRPSNDKTEFAQKSKREHLNSSSVIPIDQSRNDQPIPKRRHGKLKKEKYYGVWPSSKTKEIHSTSI
jgi:hypothetical protein